MEERANMTNVEQLIQWKTGAWKDPRMVAWYSQRMDDSSGVGRLYHHLEPMLCETFAAGRTILDVGIGTGRASLPLARKGFNVTGVDSSQSMLNECRRLAAGIPITLVQGDLPIRDARFDTIVALHVMVHFPNWRQVLEGWTARMAPGGRMIFDVHSLDHLEYVEGRRIPVEELIRQHTCNDFALYVSAQEIVATADELGLRVQAIVPYGLFNCYSRYRSPFDHRPLNDAHWWRRHLSWIGADEKLFEFCLFLEKEFVFYLGSVTTGRFMVVLDKVSDMNANRIWLERNDRLNAMLRGDASLDALLLRSPDMLESWKRALNRYLDHERNRVVFFFLWTSLWQNPQRLWSSSLLEERHARTLEMWWRQETLDRQTSVIARRWFRQEEVANIMNFRGVNLGMGMEYDLTRNLLEKYFHAFGEHEA
jgi:2-polyprenyl-3-methyl-5-hydroxy-6-metoxy-1,4-benzoquinol methylase